MTEPAATAVLAATAATATVVTTTFLGADIGVWVGAVSGVAFFMLQSTDRTILQRVGLFVPSSVGTAFAANGLVSYWNLSDKMAPVIAFACGLVLVIIASAWIRQAATKGFFWSFVQRFLPQSNKGPGND